MSLSDGLLKITGGGRVDRVRVAADPNFIRDCADGGVGNDTLNGAAGNNSLVGDGSLVIPGAVGVTA